MATVISPSIALGPSQRIRMPSTPQIDFSFHSSRILCPRSEFNSKVPNPLFTHYPRPAITDSYLGPMAYPACIRRARGRSRVPVRPPSAPWHSTTPVSPRTPADFAPPTPLPGSARAQFRAAAPQAKKYKPFLFRSAGVLCAALWPTCRPAGLSGGSPNAAGLQRTLACCFGPRGVETVIGVACAIAIACATPAARGEGGETWRSSER